MPDTAAYLSNPARYNDPTIMDDLQEPTVG
jgi:hypothetical protein